MSDMKVSGIPCSAKIDLRYSLSVNQKKVLGTLIVEQIGNDFLPGKTGYIVRV